MSTLIIGLILAGAVVMIIRKMARDKKSGGGCSGCPSAGVCGGTRGNVEE